MGIDFRRYAGCFFVFVFLFFSSNSLYPYDRGIRTDFSDGHDTFLGLSFSSFIHVNKLQFGSTDTTACIGPGRSEHFIYQCGVVFWFRLYVS